METLICLSSALIGGLLMSRLAKLLRLPAVTAYLIAGLLLGPFCIGALRFGAIGFSSMEAVENLNILSQTALGFIAFTIGNEFRVSQLKTMGRQAIVVGILQAVTATVLVDLALVLLHFLRHHAGGDRLCHRPRRHADGGPAVQSGRPPDAALADGGGH